MRAVTCKPSLFIAASIAADAHISHFLIRVTCTYASWFPWETKILAKEQKRCWKLLQKPTFTTSQALKPAPPAFVIVMPDPRAPWRIRVEQVLSTAEKQIQNALQFSNTSKFALTGPGWDRDTIIFASPTPLFSSLFLATSSWRCESRHESKGHSSQIPGQFWRPPPPPNPRLWSW